MGPNYTLYKDIEAMLLKVAHSHQPDTRHYETCSTVPAPHHCLTEVEEMCIIMITRHVVN